MESSESERSPDECLFAQSAVRGVGKVAVELYEGSPRIAKSVEHEAPERHPGHDFLGRSGK